MEEVSMLINAAISNLLTDWKRSAETFRRFGDVERATMIDTMTGELQEALHVEAEETVNLTQAAERSGLTADYLGRLVRNGRIPNVGRKNAPRVRVCDLPRIAPAKPTLQLHTDIAHLDVARAVVANS
jgi:hypothetical protein